jgi:c(7)-type cytochrome triheme protein
VLAIALTLLLVSNGAPSVETNAPRVASRVELYGRVLLDNFSTGIGLPAVTFDHWRHRALYTCRVCHVDLGFAMKAGATRVSAATNGSGAHCGACHDGKRVHEGRPIFRACYGWPHADPARGCTRCHTGPNAGPGSGYEEFVRAMPVDIAGDIDWVSAGPRLIKPTDTVEGISVKRASMRIDRDVEIRPRETWMHSVTFSHRRHVAWAGCELCHPDVFPMRRAAVTYEMEAMRAGRYCGACHLTVAFPLSTCGRCHANEGRRAVR